MTLKAKAVISGWVLGSMWPMAWPQIRLSFLLVCFSFRVRFAHVSARSEAELFKNTLRA